MKPLVLILLFFVTLPPPARAELAPETLKRAKSRIESLLGNRRSASPPPANPANPFVLPQSTPVVTEGPAPASDGLNRSDTLTRLAATLSVTGYIQIKGVPHLVVNGHNYKENELIPVREAGGSVSFLHLKNITDHDFTLELDGVELLQKHTVK
jgi:hypothetical protein